MMGPLHDNRRIAITRRNRKIIVWMRSQIILAGMGETSMDDDSRRESGMRKRREILGDDWVEKSIVNRNSFNTDFQDLITRYAWGDIWTRPHFDQRTRRVLVIGTMMALGQWDEFRL